jgi:hypothetical protein
VIAPCLLISTCLLQALCKQLVSLQEKATVSNLTLRRAFVRAVLRGIEKPELLAAMYQRDTIKAASAAISEAELWLETCISELSRVSKQSGGPADWAHIFLSVLPQLPLNVEASEAPAVATALRAAAAAATSRHAEALRLAGVAEWTIRLRSCADTATDGEWRVIVSLPSGAFINRAIFAWVTKPSSLRACFLWQANGDVSGPQSHGRESPVVARRGLLRRGCCGMDDTAEQLCGYCRRRGVAGMLDSLAD